MTKVQALNSYSDERLKVSDLCKCDDHIWDSMGHRRAFPVREGEKATHVVVRVYTKALVGYGVCDDWAMVELERLENPARLGKRVKGALALGLLCVTPILTGLACNGPEVDQAAVNAARDAVKTVQTGVEQSKAMAKCMVIESGEFAGLLHCANEQ